MKPVLLSSEDMLNPNIVDLWVVEQFQEFRQQITHKDFPCFFATSSEQRGELRYTCVNDEQENLILVEALRLFLALVSDNTTHSRFAFIAFFKPEKEERSLQNYAEKFWKTLQFIHDHDEKEWASNISPDPNSNNFEFCFEGKPIFVFGGAPAYINRRSRNLCNSFLMIFVPYPSFHGVGVTTKEGIEAREKIREKLAKWDNFDVCEEFGDSNSQPHAWKAYFISDNSSPIFLQCPLKISSA